jgi:hypothetical protein
VTDSSNSASLNVLKKQTFGMHNFNDIYQLLSVLQNPFNPRHTKFLNLSDYQIHRPEQHQVTSSSWTLPGSCQRSCESDVIQNDATWQEMFLEAGDGLGTKELF